MPFLIFTPEDTGWDATFDLLPPAEQDVFYTSGFARLCQETVYNDDEVRCAAMVSKSGDAILYPFVRRNVSSRFNGIAFTGLHDTTGLYGRGGAVGRVDEDMLAAFHQGLASYFSEMNVFCSFDRFHPVMANERLAPAEETIMNVGDFVIVDLRPEMTEVEKSFKQSVRKDIRKAERNGVRCFHEGGNDHLEDFLAIYTETMDRNAAGKFHYFSQDFFSRLVEFVGGQFLFFYAVAEGRIVSCELVLHHGLYAHSFLGGTLAEALPLAANPLLKFSILTKMKALGCHHFLLGGGVSPNDGIFKFKRAFAPQGIYPSRVGGAVWKPETYRDLPEAMTAAGYEINTGRFQFYDL